MACKLEEAVQEINKLLALPAVNKEKMMVDKLNLAKQSIESQMKLLGAQPKPEEKINISSGTKGLPGALTNHTVLSKKKGSIESDYPIEFNGTKYDSVESAYQDNKVDESKTKPAKEDSKNYKLMVELIGAKFANHPRLVSAVTKIGGLKYLDNAVHQPTSKNTVWETGGQDWFMSAMKEAYNNAIAEPVKVVEQIEEVKEPVKENIVDTVDALVRGYFTNENLQQVLAKIINKDKYVFSDMYSPYKKEMDSDSITDEEWDNYRKATNKIRSMYMKYKVDFNDISKMPKKAIEKVFKVGGRENPDVKYEIFPEVYANEEQRAAIDVLSEFLKGNENSILLKGRGGVGKTSIIAKVLDNSGVDAKNIHYITPTNKATKILKLMSEKANGITDSQFLTVAQALSYEMKNGKLVRKLDKYGNPVPPKVLGNKFTPKAKVIVVDESSMLDKDMFDKLQEIVKQNKDMKIIYMGDNVQLPPVNENSHVSSVFKNHTNNSRVELSKRMRQKAESPILPITDVLAKAVETRVNLDGSPVADTSKHSEIKFAAPTNSEVRYVTRENSIKEFIDKLKAEPESTRWIMFNNNEHAEGIKVTEMVRKELFGAEAAKKEYVKGEQLYVTSPYQDGAVLNTGDELTVQKILKENEITPINFEYWDNKIKRYATTTVKLPVTTLVVKENLLQEVLEVNAMTKESMKVIKTLPENQQYGIKQALLQNSPAYVLTSHKAQGSTYKNVYADIGNIFKNSNNIRVENVQSAYVATSRASESLVMVDVPMQYRENIKPKIGSVVTYKNDYYIVKKVNEKANNVQLINKNGDSLPGTPGIDKVQFVKQLPVTEFNGVEYIYDEKNDRLYTENGEKWKYKADPTRVKIISSVKQEEDIIVPSEAFKKNVNNKIECKE